MNGRVESDVEVQRSIIHIGSKHNLQLSLTKRSYLVSL